MFAFSRSVAKSAQRFNTRNMGSAAKGAYRPKSTSEVWLGDSGAYPVILVMAGAVSLASGAVLYNLSYSNECRVSKTSRKSIFRGPLKGVGINDE